MNQNYNGLEEDSIDTIETSTREDHFQQNKMFDSEFDKKEETKDTVLEEEKYQSFGEFDGTDQASEIIDEGRLSKISPKKQTVSNERDLHKDSTVFQNLAQTWLNNFIDFAMTQEQVTEDNMMFLKREERTVNVYGEWCNLENQDIHSTIWVLTKKGILKYGTLLILVESSTIISIYMIRMIIDYLERPQDHGAYFNYIIFILFCMCRLSAIVTRNYYDFHVYNYFKFVQNAIQVWLYRDISRLKLWQLPESKRATIINILTKDIEAFVQGSWQFPYLLVVPINTLFSIIILYNMFGPAILFSYLIMVLLILFQNYSNKLLSNLQFQLFQKTDTRILYVSQILKGIKVIKNRLNENAFANKIKIIREVFSRRIDEVIESSILRQQVYMAQSHQEATILDEEIDPLESLRAIGKLSKQLNTTQEPIRQGPFIKLDHVYAQWNIQEDQDTGEDLEQDYNIDQETTIRDISFEFQNHEKVAIIGEVGCGKTSLFLTILKELCIVKGTIKVNTRDIVYVEQDPLIITGTVRSNILFGLPYNQNWYNQVIKACCLMEDFVTFVKNDLTKLGEMGVQLSGGQRSRIALARAIYQKDAKILLIDGSLSSLDAKIKQQVLQEAILGLCKDKIVLMITYDLNAVKQMDYIMMMENGKIKQLKKVDEFFQANERELVRVEQQIKKQPEEGKDNQNQQDIEMPNQQLIKDENKKIQKITWSVIQEYFSYSKYGQWSLAIMVLIYMVINLNGIGVGLFLAFDIKNRVTNKDNEENMISDLEYNLTLIGIMILAILTSFIGLYICNKIFLSINQNIHDAMVNSVLNTKIKFFEVNTQGIILNRFSKDVKLIDNIIFSFLDMLDGIIKCIFSGIVIMISCPWILILSLISAFYLKKIRQVNLHIVKDTYRLLFTLVSPINSLIQDTINGLTTIRAFGRSEYFLTQMFDACDVQTQAFVTSNGVNRWVAQRIDLSAYVITSIYTFFVLFINQPTSYEGLVVAALGFQLIVDISRLLNRAVRSTVGFETDMVIIQRLLDYTKLKSEDHYKINSNNNKRQQNSLSSGSIKFENVQMSYSSKLKPALSNLSFFVSDGEKLAIVGRTGSGKSSLFQLLQRFRMPTEGQILIDNCDMRSISAHTLRQNLAVVMQNSFTMPAEKIRVNLDPEGKYSDEQINSFLRSALLTDFNAQSSASQLSAGQLQLLNIAQAFLIPKAKIVLLDEPTSQIDHKTQQQVLKNLFRHFRNSTVIMIAHHLDTAIGFCDKIMVLNQGKLVDHDQAFKLLANQIDDTEITRHDSLFAQMVMTLDKEHQAKLFNKAKKRYLK